MNRNYKYRIVEKEIKQTLATVGAISIIGPKYCGKTFFNV